MWYGLLIIIALLLLVISFFVLIASEKSKSNTLKIFGYIISILIWIFLAYIFVAHFFDMNMQNVKNYHQMMQQNSK
jgi:ABC-type transport system involved in cytochrome c biogenesis permease subunit